MGKGIGLTGEIEKKIGQIARDNIHGASYLAAMSLEVLGEAAQSSGAGAKDCLEFRNFLRETARKLIKAQPAMHVTANMLARVISDLGKKVGGDKDVKQAIEALKELIECQKRESEEAVEKIGEHGATILAERYAGNSRILTLSDSSTVEAIIKRLNSDDVEVIIAESRPMCEGVRLAKKLAGAGFEVTVITDAMLGLATPGAACALVGADTLYSDGAVVNKAGTRLLALAAKMDKIPLFCCAEIMKIKAALVEKPGNHIPSQAPRPPEEILKKPPRNVRARNIYFDLTDYYLVAGYITEQGFMRRKEIGQISEKLAARYRKVFGEDEG